MIYFIIGLFFITALFGLIILRNWLTGSHTTRTVVYMHGVFAALGLVLLIYLVRRDSSTPLTTGLVLLAVAAVGGFYMFFKDLRGKFSPTWLAVTHALLAVGGVIFLLLTLI